MPHITRSNALGFIIPVLLIAASFALALPRTCSAEPDRPFTVIDPPRLDGKQITPFLRYQCEMAWRQDELRAAEVRAIRTEADFLRYQRDLRGRLLEIIGGLPAEKSPLNARITGTIDRDGYRIEKLVFESFPGFHVTALVYVPDEVDSPRPGVLVGCGHSPVAKAFRNYQEISVRLVRRGYVVLCWDPVGQGERSQYWNAGDNASRYNRVCGEHAILGNVATLAGLSLARFEAWDGIRALDYLAARPEVDPDRIAITGTSGGGAQSALVMALEPRVFAALPSCYISSLPMRMANRIFEDPDSDPEQDIAGILSRRIGHPGFCLLNYPRPLVISAAVEDFFPIEGARKTYREAEAVYRRFGRAGDIALTEGYHPHSFSDGNQLFAFGFLDRLVGNPPRREFEPVEFLDVDELNVTAAGQVRLEYPDGRHMLELVREHFRQERPGKSLDIAAVYRGGGYPDIDRWTVREYDRGRDEQSIGWEKTGDGQHGGCAVDRYVLRHSGLLELPVLHVRPDNAGERRRVMIWLDHRRKLNEDNFHLVEPLLTDGWEVVSFDFRGQGENMMRYAVASIDDDRLAAVALEEQYYSQVSGVMANYVYNTLLTGRPYFLQMVEDVEIVSRFARDKLGAARVAVTGRGVSHTVAAAAARSIDGLELVAAPDGELVDWAGIVDGMRETWPIEYMLPGGAYIDLE